MMTATGGDLDAIRRRDCPIAIRERDPPPELADLLATLDLARIGRLRLETAIGQLEAVLVSALPDADLKPLRDDCLACARLVAPFCPVGWLRLRLERVENDACRRFHADNTSIRLLCTYLGPGTEWLPEHADPADPAAIRRVPTLAIALLKGRTWPDGSAACIHRSPPIAGEGMRRLLLAVEPVDL